MVIKIIWTPIAVNSVALVCFIIAFLFYAESRTIDSIERGWMGILVLTGLAIILLAAIPLYYSKSSFTVFITGFFAILPLFILITFKLNQFLPTLRKKDTFATTYYKDKTQRKIASAIETGDKTLLLELIKGQNLNIQGNRVWDWDGLNYLQFAIRVRGNPIDFPYDETVSDTIIRILIENGSNTTSALAEATQHLSIDMLTLFLDKGANPNIRGFTHLNPLIFELIGSDKKKNDVAILLLQRGADKDSKGDYGFTPVMYAAYNAGINIKWSDCWRLVLYMLKDAKCDYRYTTKNGMNLQNVIAKIRADAAEKNVGLTPGFYAVVDWLKQHKIDTAPATVRG